MRRGQVRIKVSAWLTAFAERGGEVWIAKVTPDATVHKGCRPGLGALCSCPRGS
ncbi:hypothetical protein [Amycolatopsis keratiniphila]|uniref:hypothetical protein n=1 Tax=Amycolatopsis keratiniphila TaxID=129921 RepID=UPI00087A2E71|nr:hypothetical protein [Amycolatopsis keratiniphila]SDU39927.1 hypothetical protein SAMN04489733_3772 [Amycolatopsis keratiniphila]